jgi:hypothetical protein
LKLAADQRQTLQQNLPGDYQIGRAARCPGYDPRPGLPVVVQHRRAEFPWTELSWRLAELVRANTGEAHARLSSTDGRTTLLTDEAIRLRLNMPNLEGEVRLDDLNSDDQDSHLMEVNLGILPRHQADAMVGFGRGGDELIGRVSPPYGSDILVAIVSSEPLFAGRLPV